ncbi:MAG: WhiB family transcriptional regulator [Acidimicrobiia bacterium]|nr:WhiB family transcriptional regulator [Acidimicrobiia bacterium]
MRHPRAPWVREALCRGTDPSVWFPARGESASPQKACCRACPVRTACLAAAMRHGEHIGLSRIRSTPSPARKASNRSDAADCDRAIGAVLLSE